MHIFSAGHRTHGALGPRAGDNGDSRRMRKLLMAAALVATFGLAAPTGAAAQEPGDGLIEVGAMAPDFELTGATRHGVLRDQIRLSDYRGETVVLAFFFRVRTRG